MNFLKKIIILLIFLFPISHSFAVVTEIDNQAFAEFETEEDLGSKSISGIHFNNDGTSMFALFLAHSDGNAYVEEFTLSTPFDISTKSSSYVARCDISSHGFSINAYDLDFSSDGKSLFYVAWGESDYIYRFDLSAPFKLDNCVYKQRSTDIDVASLQKFNSASVPHAKNRARAISLSNDGKKVFVGFQGAGTNYNTKVLEYNLSTPYDLSTISLNANGGVDLDGEVSNINSIAFSSNGKRFFVIDHQDVAAGRDVTQVSLGSSFDSSSYTIDGRSYIFGISGISQLRAITFSKNGLKMFIGNDYTDTAQTYDRIWEFDLVCPFNIITGKCPSITENTDRTGMAEAQVELAKRTINFSTNSALNRLKWIRRNKDKQNLSNQNIKLNFSNNMLSSLKELPITSFKKISTTKKNNDSNKNYFYWSEGSISIGRVGDTSIASTKEVYTNSLTFGLDKFTDDYGIEGFAFRFGNDDVDVGRAGSNLDSNTYNITYYSTSPIEDDTKFVDKIFGYGKIRSDITTVLDGKNLNADRTGNQIYGTVKIKDEYIKDNFTFIPSGQFDFGHTILKGYQEAGNGGIIVEDQHVRTKNLRAAMAVVEDISNEKYSLKRHGKLEYVAELDRSSNFKYTYVSDGSIHFNDTLHTGALHNLNGEIGIDIIFPEHYSVFIIYERNHAFGTGYTDNLYIALGYLPNKETEYAFSLNGSDNLMSKFEIKKNINGYDLSLNINDDLTNLGDSDEASINLNKVF